MVKAYYSINGLFNAKTAVLRFLLQRAIFIYSTCIIAENWAKVNDFTGFRTLPQVCRKELKSMLNYLLKNRGGRCWIRTSDPLGVNENVCSPPASPCSFIKMGLRGFEPLTSSV